MVRPDIQSDYPGSHPLPPDNLDNLRIPIVALRPPWFRFHKPIHDPIHFGRSRGGRFDDPSEVYGVLYCGEDAECAFIESYGQRVSRSFTFTELRERTLSIISASRSINLVDLTGSGLVQIGADARLFAGEHRISQHWSRAFFEHHSQPDGILYRARHDPSRRAIALFERDGLDLWSTPIGFDVLGRVLATYRFALVP
jgi:hypothetical protein